MQNILLSNRIKEQCKRRKVAIKSLLMSCEMNRNTIYDLEKKGSFPSADKLSRIADSLNCSTDYLLGRTDDINTGDIQLEGIDFILHSEMKDLAVVEKEDVLDYIRCKKLQKPTTENSETDSKTNRSIVEEFEKAEMAQIAAHRRRRR